MGFAAGTAVLERQVSITIEFASRTMSCVPDIPRYASLHSVALPGPRPEFTHLDRAATRLHTPRQGRGRGHASLASPGAQFASPGTLLGPGCRLYFLRIFYSRKVVVL